MTFYIWTEAYLIFELIADIALLALVLAYLRITVQTACAISRLLPNGSAMMHMC